MDLTPRIPASRQVINGYGDGGFRVAGTRYEGSVLIFPDRTLAWPVTTLEEVDAAALAEVPKAEPAVEILLLGMGPQIRRVADDLRRAMKVHGIVVEGLDTGAAARTYNVLMGESRRVAAALIAV